MGGTVWAGEGTGVSCTGDAAGEDGTGSDKVAAFVLEGAVTAGAAAFVAALFVVTAGGGGGRAAALFVFKLG